MNNETRINNFFPIPITSFQVSQMKTSQNKANASKTFATCMFAKSNTIIHVYLVELVNARLRHVTSPSLCVFVEVACFDKGLLSRDIWCVCVRACVCVSQTAFWQDQESNRKAKKTPSIVDSEQIRTN